MKKTVSREVIACDVCQQEIPVRDYDIVTIRGQDYDLCRNCGKAFHAVYKFLIVAGAIDFETVWKRSTSHD